MRVAALNDVHGNPAALRAVLAELEGEHVDLIVVGGDAVPGPLPSVTIELLRALGDRAAFVRGNTDRWTVEEFDSLAAIRRGDPHPAHARGALAADVRRRPAAPRRLRAYARAVRSRAGRRARRQRRERRHALRGTTRRLLGGRGDVTGPPGFLQATKRWA